MKDLLLYTIIADLAEDCKLNNEYDTKKCLDHKLRLIRNRNKLICNFKDSLSNYTVDVNGGADRQLNIIGASNEEPVITSSPCYDYEFEEFSFTKALFNDLYTDDDPLGYVRIVSLPSEGTLQYSGVDVVAGQIIDINNITNLTYDFGSLYSDTEKTIQFSFQLADNTLNHIFTSYTAIFQICIPEKPNQPPTIGALSINIDESGEHVFTTANLTTGISYSDPEGDDPYLLQVRSLPANGVLYHNGLPVVVDQIITYTDIEAGLFKFTPDDLDVSYTISFTIRVQDTESGQWSS